MAGLFDSGRPEILKHNVQSFLLPVSRSASTNESASFFQPIIFQFIPDLKDNGDTADFESLGDGLGRAEQYKMFKNGKSRVFQLSTTFAALDSKTLNTAWVQQQVMRLRALTKPVYDREALFNKTSTNYYAPPLVIFTHGKQWVNIPVVVTSVSPSIPDEAQLDEEGLPTAVTVEIQLETNYPYGYVPGYLNYWKIWNLSSQKIDGDKTYNPKQLSFGGSITTSSSIAQELINQNSATAGTAGISAAGQTIIEL